MNNEIQTEIVKILMKISGTTNMSEASERPLIATVSFAIYGEPSSVMLEVEGSPVRGSALITFNKAPQKSDQRGRQTHDEWSWYNAKVTVFGYNSRHNQVAKTINPANNKNARKIIRYAEDIAIQGYQESLGQKT